MILNKHGNFRVIPANVFYDMQKLSKYSVSISPRLAITIPPAHQITITKGPLTGLILLPETGEVSLYFDKLNKLASALNLPYINQID